MPYIKQVYRVKMEPSCFIAGNAGELNFQFTILAQAYMKLHGLSYQTINDIVGALEGAKAEFQRRIVAPYEDRKIQENGDLYEQPV